VLRRSRQSRSFHGSKPVLTVPSVGPARISGQVAVGVVGEGLLARGDEYLPRHFGDGILARWSHVVLHAGDRDVPILRGCRVVHGQLPVKPVVLPDRGDDVRAPGRRGDRHLRIGPSVAGHLEGPRNRAAVVLIEEIGGVVRGQAVGGGGLAVADVVEGVAEIVAEDRNAGGQFLGGGGDLAERIVAVIPIGVRFPGQLGALVGGVVAIKRGERRGRRAAFARRLRRAKGRVGDR